MKEKKWILETVEHIDSLEMSIDDLIKSLQEFQGDGFTHCCVEYFDDEDPYLDNSPAQAYLCVKRLETNADFEARQKRERAETAKAKAQKEKEERKLFAKLKKKYGK